MNADALGAEESAHKITRKKLGKPKTGAHVMDRLTDLQVRRMSKSGSHADGGGLYLQVAPSGAKSWVFRYNRKLGAEKAKAREMGLGPTHTIGLAEARQLALECRKLLLKGIDPIEHRRTTRATQLQQSIEAARVAERDAVTFSMCVAKFIGAKAAEWSNDKHRQQWENTLATYAAPVIGSMPVADIKTPDVVRVFERDGFWQEKTETAQRVRQRIEAVLDWATVQQYRKGGDNPARWGGCLEHVLADPSKIKKVRPMPALPFAQVKDFMAELRKQKGQGAKALELAALTAMRSQAVRFATWGEFDMDAMVWTAPAAHMKVKAHGDHRVPMSTAVMALLKSLRPTDARPDDLVFRGKDSQPLSDMTLSKVIKTMNKGTPRWVDPQIDGRPEIVPHGFRSTFRDWASEVSEHDANVVEMALAHSIGSKVEAAYRRGELFEKRVALMQDWATYCEGGAA